MHLHTVGWPIKVENIVVAGVRVVAAAVAFTRQEEYVSAEVCAHTHTD